MKPGAAIRPVKSIPLTTRSREIADPRDTVAAHANVAVIAGSPVPSTMLALRIRRSKFLHQALD